MLIKVNISIKLYMKKIPSYILIFIFILQGFNSLTFALENNTINQQTETATENDMFAPIDLDLTDYSYMNKQNKKFKLSAQKESKPSQINSTGGVWDENMLFRYQFYSDESNLRVLPAYGSLGSFVTTKLDENTSLMVGQDSLTKINGDVINFSYPNYSYYSSGARITGEENNFNYSVGAFTETDTLNQQLAAVVTTKPSQIKGLNGKFYMGGGVFTNLMKDVNKSSSGILAQYQGEKLSIGGQLSQISYSKSGYQESHSAHLLTTYRVNPHLQLKNKIVKNFDFDELQGEVGIVFNPMKETDRLELEVVATNYQTQNVVTRQRLRFTTSFKF